MQHFSYMPSFGIVSTHPPTPCGIATFSAALSDSLVECGASVGVIRIADESESTRNNVVGELVGGSPSSMADAAALLNQRDIAVIQHEYGIYGGPDGDEVVQLMEQVRVPTMVVAHTVLKHPTPQQHSVLERIMALADRVVVMSDSAHSRLAETFPATRHKVVTIPHGAGLPTTAALKRSARPIILTWGLIGPGKGIERVIDAMAVLKKLPGSPRYVIAGRTHPKVLAAEGEAYREACIARAERLGVADAVSFDPMYRNPASLTALILQASVVVLPYDSREQVTSGVLVDSIATGRPVVATAFPHAVELLGSGAGLVVPHDDADAMTNALKKVLTNPRVAGAMASEAREMAPAMAWPVVADAYLHVAQRLVAASSASA
jgi:glycosyltransferase involved in cell wall biosynthesis